MATVYSAGFECSMDAGASWEPVRPAVLAVVVASWRVARAASAEPGVPLWRISEVYQALRRGEVVISPVAEACRYRRRLAGAPESHQEALARLRRCTHTPASVLLAEREASQACAPLSTDGTPVSRETP